MSNPTSGQTAEDAMSIGSELTALALSDSSEGNVGPFEDAESALLYDSRSESDSGIGGFSIMSSTMSMRSSLLQSVEENGRTYHKYKQGKYPLPNDELERDRLDLQHALSTLTLSGKLYLAPLEEHNFHNVLDLATGTGIWAIDFAIQNPSSNVLGTDLSAIQPEYVPPNCHFEIDDAEDDWTFSKKFGFIHTRALLSCFEDPSSIIGKAYDALAPGGWLEMQDALFPMRWLGDPPRDSHLYRWNALIVEAAERSGRPWTNVQYYSKWMKEKGFVDVEEKMFFWPQSQWVKGRHLKELSQYFQTDMLQGLEGMTLKLFMGILGWSREAVLAFLVGVRDDFKSTALHSYMAITMTYGRKPF